MCLRAGFADEDMEKPTFTHVMPLIPKRPHVLSLEGEQPVIQVRALLLQWHVVLLEKYIADIDVGVCYASPCTAALGSS